MRKVIKSLRHIFLGLGDPEDMQQLAVSCPKSLLQEINCFLIIFQRVSILTAVSR